MNIEDLKCCGNCKNIYFEYELYYCRLKGNENLLSDSVDVCDYCDKWDFDGMNKEQRKIKGE